jgi:hypothetical protein
MLRFHVLLPAIGLNPDHLAIGGVQPGQFDRERRRSVHLSAAVRRHYSSLYSRAPLGDHKTVHDQLFIECAAERVAGRVSLRRQTVHKAHREEHAGVQRYPVRRFRRGSRSHIHRLATRGWRRRCSFFSRLGCFRRLGCRNRQLRRGLVPRHDHRPLRNRRRVFRPHRLHGRLPLYPMACRLPRRFGSPHRANRRNLGPSRRGGWRGLRRTRGFGNRRCGGSGCGHRSRHGVGRRRRFGNRRRGLGCCRLHRSRRGGLGRGSRRGGRLSGRFGHLVRPLYDSHHHGAAQGAGYHQNCDLQRLHRFRVLTPN